jgi:LacI family transcriptional regulator
MEQQVAIVMSEVFLRRLTPSLIPFVRHDQNFRIVRINRPIVELIEVIEAMQPDAIITEWLPDVTEALTELKIPTVIADTDYRYPGVVSIDVNDHAVGVEAAEAFVQAGFTNFAFLGNNTPYSKQRLEGFVSRVSHISGVHTYEMTSFVAQSYSEDFAPADRVFKDWLISLPKPVAIFAAHDPLGRFLCGVCRQLGLAVPDSVSVIGANNDELVCGLSYPMLSSVSIPWNRIGELAGESMQALLAGEGASEAPILVEPSGVVVRHSANFLAVDDLQLRRALAFFSEHLHEPITIDIMCRKLRIARRNLERKFAEYLECTPWQMLCRLRVNRAKQLLSQTEHPVSIVSEFCGFNDPERLAVVFKRLVGKSPSNFRKMLRHSRSERRH